MLSPAEDVEVGADDALRVEDALRVDADGRSDGQLDESDDYDSFNEYSDDDDQHSLPLLPLLTDTSETTPTANGHAHVLHPPLVAVVLPEHHKTALALLYALCSFVCTCASLALVHERRPESNPLPDSVLDRVSRQTDHRITVLYASEILITLQTLSAVLLVAFHMHRLIVLRRVAMIVGTLYLYRAVTMWVTVLPSSDPTYECAPKLPPGQNMTFGLLSQRVFTIITGFGLSINGHHIYCGDSIYSGHTMIILIGHLVIREYSPRRCAWLSWVTCINAITAIILLMLSRGHYSIDVVIAYFITTRTWCFYHLLAHQRALREPSLGNSLTYLWWFRPVLYMEQGVPMSKLPNRLALPSGLERIHICRRLLSKFRSSRQRAKIRRASRKRGQQISIAHMARNLLTQHEP